MQPSMFKYTNQNQGYYVFIHEDSSPSQSVSEVSNNATIDNLEWDEEVLDSEEIFPSVEDDTWASLYKYYAQMLEQTEGSIRRTEGVINQVDNKQRGAAHYAAEQGHAGVLRLLLQTDCKIDTYDVDGLTPLHIAVKCGQINAVKVLLEASVNPNRCTMNNDSYTALHIAAVSGYTHIIEALVSGGTNLETRNGSEYTPLHLAVKEKQTNVVLKLIQLGSNVNVEDDQGTTPLCNAVWERSSEIVSALLTANARIPSRYYLLHYAVHHKLTDIVTLLIRNGAIVNLRDNNGDTPLLIATRFGHIQITRYLLEQGASVNYPNSITGLTPLHEAIACSNDFNTFEQIFYILQNYHVNLNSMCFSVGDTPLFRAILLDRDKTAKLLIKHGADVNLCSSYSSIDNLTLAINRRKISVVHLLILAGAQPPRDWKCAPRPLSHLVRLMLRRHLSSTILYRSIQMLPLPQLLKDFLLFENEES